MRGEVPTIRLSRLVEVAPEEVMAFLNDPDIARHMPLAGDEFDAEATRKWVEGKNNQWEQNGYGPWAVHANEEFAGWCGFQKEEGEADFALVLRKRFWGLGRQIYVKAVGRGFDELGYKSIVVTLPPSRKSWRVKFPGFPGHPLRRVSSRSVHGNEGKEEAKEASRRVQA